MILLLAASAALAWSATPHEEVVEHRGAQVRATYHADVTTRMKTVGMSAGPRGGIERCRWTADVHVVREVRGAGERPALRRRLPAVQSLDGSVPGHCMAARKAVETALAGQTDAVQGHVREMAARDRPALLAEIDAARGLALN